jgi:hypothetical protein
MRSRLIFGSSHNRLQTLAFCTSQGAGTMTTTRPGAMVAKERPSAVAAFLDKLKPTLPHGGGSGRLIFALDATASREPSWDLACQIHGEMFEAAAQAGGLQIQLVYYRGFDECRASRWAATAAALHHLMRAVSCVGGETQLCRVLRHALVEAGRGKIGALIFVGDACEEPVDGLCHQAGELGRLGVPVFLFHEGAEPSAAAAFKQIAQLSHGAYVAFDTSAPGRLKVLLGGVAAYAAGGLAALEQYGKTRGGSALLLTAQLNGQRWNGPSPFR